MSEQYIDGFREAVGSVARERMYLAFLDAPTLEMTRSFIADNLRENWPHVIALAEGNVVGWCGITSYNRPVYSHAGNLGVGVIKSFRGMGIGEDLIKTAIELAKLKGLTRIELQVRESNKPAIALYEKLGFSVEGLHRNAIFQDDQYENQLTMALLLT